MQQQAQQALTDAAPELAKLQLAQPAAALRPLWESQRSRPRASRKHSSKLLK
jgi:exonuclease SbcC